MADNSQGSNNKSRQKIIIIVLVVVGGFLAWQVFGMFGGGTSKEETKTEANQPPPPPPMPTPKAAELPKAPAPMTQREMELMQLQQETEAKYLAAINELQMLRIQRDIAQTNKDIASAKLDTVTAQKNIVTLLTPDTNTNYSQRLTNPEQAAAPTPDNTGNANPNAPIAPAGVTYTVISVTEIQGHWGAVVGVQGKLYSVHVGDVLPADNSKVVSIDKSGVVLEKDGTKKTVSLIPII